VATTTPPPVLGAQPFRESSSRVPYQEHLVSGAEGHVILAGDVRSKYHVHNTRDLSKDASRQSEKGSPAGPGVRQRYDSTRHGVDHSLQSPRGPHLEGVLGVDGGHLGEGLGAVHIGPEQRAGRERLRPSNHVRQS
jgi:hypothetical protein